MQEIDRNRLYQQVILDHNRSPKNYWQLANHSHSSEGYNPLCGDRLWVYLRLVDGIIEEISFTGEGCAISKASASLMTGHLTGCSPAEARRQAELFNKLLHGEDLRQQLGKLKVFSTIWHYPARVKCAALAWHAMCGALTTQQCVSTE